MNRLLGLGVRGARRVGGFAVSMILLTLPALLMVPATIAAGGLETWSSIVLAQALALIPITVVAWGYNINGPAAIASMSTEDGLAYFRIAERTRLILSIPSYSILAAMVLIVPNPDPVAGLLGAAPLAVNSFSAFFYYVGVGKPLWFLVLETLPRATSTVVGAIVLTLGAPIEVGLGIPAIGGVCAVLASNAWIRVLSRRHESVVAKDRPVRAMPGLRTQIRAVTASLLTSGVDAMPVLILAGVAPGIVGHYGVFDRINRMYNMALWPVTSTLQGWVPRRMATGGSLRPIGAVLGVGLCVSATLVIGVIIAGPPFIRWLSAGEVVPTPLECLLCGAVIATCFFAALVSNACLVPLKGIGGVVVANVVGAGVTLCAIPTFLLGAHSVSRVLAAVVVGTSAQLFILLTMTAVKAKRMLREMEPS